MRMPEQRLTDFAARAVHVVAKPAAFVGSAYLVIQWVGCSRLVPKLIDI